MLQVQTAGIGVHEGGQGKPQPLTRGGSVGHHRVVWEEAQATRCCCGRGKASLPSGLKKTCAASVWKRRGRVIRAAWIVDLKRAVRIRAQKMELPRESERMGRSSRRRPDVRALVNPYTICLIDTYANVSSSYHLLHRFSSSPRSQALYPPSFPMLLIVSGLS
jgi:hypothetical protein